MCVCVSFAHAHRLGMSLHYKVKFFANLSEVGAPLVERTNRLQDVSETFININVIENLLKETTSLSAGMNPSQV